MWNFRGEKQYVPLYETNSLINHPLTGLLSIITIPNVTLNLEEK